jgi:hypothetical protein
VRARVLDDQHVVAGRDQQHVGQLAADHGSGRAVASAVADRYVPSERYRAGCGAARQPRQQPGLQVRRGRGRDHRARDHRGHERAGRHGPAQLLGHDHQLGQPEPGAAVLLGQVQAEPAQLAQLGPVPGQRLGLGFEQGPGGAAGVTVGEELGHGLGQGPVIIGDGDRHG